MLINFKDTNLKTYRCRRNVANFLVYKKHIPILSFDDEYYYFADNEDLEFSLKEVPMIAKVRDILR